ncbi:MAG: glycosyltransferase [Acidobacteriia bacterium]|nr:glycosyltransferase [Terriglobia bacterium]
MKVLHVIPSVAPWRGGPPAAMRAIACGLAAKGVETHVATTNDNRPALFDVPLGQPVWDGGVVYHYFPRQTEFYISSIPLSTWLWRSARNYDVIHTHLVFSYCPNAAACIAYRRRVPYIVRPAGVLNRWGFENRRPLVKRLSFAAIEKRLLSRAAAVQYTTEQEREEAARLGFAHQPVVIPNPVKLAEPGSVARGEFRAEYPALAHRPIILFLSRIDQKKGVDLLLPAFRDVLREHPSAALVIAGEGEAEFVDPLGRLASELGIADSVFWPGFLSGSKKAAAFADADLFVLPSYSENFGVALVEAMGFGVPVVLTDQVGIHREVSGERAGVVTPAASQPLAAAMGLLLRDGGLRTEMGANALRLAGRYSVQAVADQLINMYAELCPASLSPALRA